MQCKSCGAEFPDTNHFCPACGQAVEQTATQSNEAPSQQAAAQSNEAPDPQAAVQNNQQPYGQAQFQNNDQSYGQNQFQSNNQSYGQPQFQNNNQSYGQPQFQNYNQSYGQNQFQNNAQAYGQPYGGGPMTKSQFFKLPGMRSFRGSLIGAACVLYASAGISLINALASNVFAILDVVIILGLALGMHLGRSRACAFVALGYSIINIIYMITLTGLPGGWLITVGAGIGCYATCKMQSAYKNYVNTGYVPMG